MNALEIITAIVSVAAFVIAVTALVLIIRNRRG